jgi:hypothetical protein
VIDQENKDRRKRGFARNRPLTDCGICCIFILFFIAWLLIFFASFVNFGMQGITNINFDGNKN